MNYYAILENGKVVSVTSSSTTINNDNYIEITSAQYSDSSLIGKSYNPYTKAFTSGQSWSANTDQIRYPNTQLPLTHKLAMMINSDNQSVRFTNRTTSSASITFTGTMNTPVIGTYLLSLKYAGSTNGLIDQSLYAIYVDTSKTLVSTVNLVKCNNSSDSLFVTQANDTLSFNVTYNSANTSIVSVDARII